MQETGLHPELEMRLKALAARISDLEQKLTQAEGTETITDFGELSELRRRYATLEEQLGRLNQQGQGFIQSTKAEIEAMTSDLMSMVEDHIMRCDSRLLHDEHSTGTAKP